MNKTINSELNKSGMSFRSKKSSKNEDGFFRHNSQSDFEAQDLKVEEISDDE